MPGVLPCKDDSLKMAGWCACSFLFRTSERDKHPDSCHVHSMRTLKDVCPPKDVCPLKNVCSPSRVCYFGFEDSVLSSEPAVLSGLGWMLQGPVAGVLWDGAPHYTLTSYSLKVLI